MFFTCQLKYQRKLPLISKVSRYFCKRAFMVIEVWDSLFHTDKISNATYFPNHMGTIPNASIKSCNPALYFFFLFIYLFLKFIYLIWRLITLQYCSGFCHTLTWISHGFTCVPHSEPSSHIPPHPIPLGHASAPALSTLSHALNLDWRSVSHMIIYMFQWYSVRSSHLHLLSQSPKDCSKHLWNPVL